ncbi:hypothetical protein [Nostoc sp. CCY 9925]|uniref:hypothetical protein n=1 Tax=Nostoc sp. CCY 9925 TaxID=3103865 RepID=UPI0039C66D9D
MSTNLSELGNSSTAFSQLDLEADVLVIGGGPFYAAGDAATRELICGGFIGGGSHTPPGQTLPDIGQAKQQQTTPVNAQKQGIALSKFSFLSRI